VKSLVAERAWTHFFVETERLEALVRELTDYEIRVERSEAGFTGEWAERAYATTKNSVDVGATCSTEDFFATIPTAER